MFVPDLSVDHFASASLGENWNGIASEKPAGKWNQLGILTAKGFSSFVDMQALPDVIKLTDTKFGQSVVIESKDVNSYVRIVPAGLEFLGKPLGCARHRSRSAEPQAGTGIAAGARPYRDLRLHGGPSRRPVCLGCIEDNGRRSATYAVKV